MIGRASGVEGGRRGWSLIYSLIYWSIALFGGLRKNKEHQSFTTWIVQLESHICVSKLVISIASAVSNSQKKSLKVSSLKKKKKKLRM